MEVSYYKLISFSEVIAYVSTPSVAAHIVNLSESSGIYLGFQDNHLSYCHAMPMCKDQVLDPEDFTSPVYIVDNYRNIYFQDFALDPIQIKDFKTLIFYLVSLVQKKSGRPQKKRLQKSAKKKNKAKKNYIICSSENHNRRRYNQEPNEETDFEVKQEIEDDENIIHSDS